MTDQPNPQTPPQGATPPAAPATPPAQAPAAPPALDIAALKAVMKEVVAEEVKPLREKVQAQELTKTYGFDEQQLAAFQKEKAKNLSDEDALALAVANNVALFPQRVQVPGVIPPGGTSPLRGKPQKEDFVAKMKEAEANKDWSAAEQFATYAFHERIQRGRAVPTN